MQITPLEAQQSLEAIDEAVLVVKRVIDRQTSRIVLLWGVVYLLGPLAMYFWPTFGIIPQQALLILAISYSIFFTSRNSVVTGATSQRIGALWWLTFGFGAIWFFVLDPTGFAGSHVDGQLIARKMWAYGVSLAMFVYVVMGTWVGTLYVVTGVAVTLFTLAGLLWLGDWYWLWCGLTGGSTLLAAGVYLRRQAQA